MPRLLLLLLLTPAVLPAEPLRLAVAANFRHTLAALNSRFEAVSGYTTATSSASTGVLYSQIRHGAPFDVFLSADREAPLRLQRDDLAVAGSTRCYALGLLVLAGAGQAQGLEALANPANSMAIANPATAPYGRAALQVLERPQFAAGSTRKLVRGTNVLQAWQHWHSGAVDLALLPASLAPAGVPVPAHWHNPLEQHLVLLRRAQDNPAALAYLDFLRSEEAQNLIRRAGYGSCS